MSAVLEKRRAGIDLLPVRGGEACGGVPSNRADAGLGRRVPSLPGRGARQGSAAPRRVGEVQRLRGFSAHGCGRILRQSLPQLRDRPQEGGRASAVRGNGVRPLRKDRPASVSARTAAKARRKGPS